MNMIKRVLNRAKYECNYIKLYFKDIKNKKVYPAPKIKSISESLDDVLKYKASISRYGEGELYIIEGKDIPFQKHDKLLAEKLKKILVVKDTNFFVGLYDVFEEISWDTRKSKKFWTRHIVEYRELWNSLLDTKQTYYNARISRFYLENKNKQECKVLIKKLKALWSHRNIVIIEGEFSRLGVGNDLFDNSKSIKRVLAPSKDAFCQYEQILKFINKNIDKEDLVLLALGPTATAMAYDLYKLGYQALDLGHVDIEYEWYLMNAKKKIAIKNKYTNEAKDGDKVQDILNQKYQSEIIDRFV